MNFLQLCQRTRQELGVSGVGPASVLNQIGHFAKIVDWVRDACLDVQQTQGLQSRAFADAPLVAGKATYEPLSDFGFDIKALVADAQFLKRGASKLHLTVIPWESARHLFPADGTPIAISMVPGGSSVFLWPTPTAGLTLSLEYEPMPKVLNGDADTPPMKEPYHMAIVWRAVMFGAAHDENVALFQAAQVNLRAIINRMMRYELPTLEVGTLV